MLPIVTRQDGFNSSNMDVSSPPRIQRYYTFSFVNYITCREYTENLLNQVKVKRSNTY